MCEVLPSSSEEKLEVEELQRKDDEITLNYSEPTLLTMPVEIFLKICSFLDADFISETLSKVCVRFNNILNDTELWKYWVKSRLKHRYPALGHLRVWQEEGGGGGLHWQRACARMDREAARWRHVARTTTHALVKDVHYASVDAVLLLQEGEWCVSSGRDRGLALWQVSAVAEAARAQQGGPEGGGGGGAPLRVRPAHLRTDAHAGWVWDLAAAAEPGPARLYSASWDNSVKLWDVSADLTCLETFMCGMSALSVVTCEGLVYAGLYSSKVLAFDARAGAASVASYRTHKGPVLGLRSLGHHIASIGEDRTLCVWDVRARRTLSQVRVGTERAYPVCLSWSRRALYVGDSRGTLHLVDPERYALAGAYCAWPEPAPAPVPAPDGRADPPPPLPARPAAKVTGVHHELGAMLLCCDQGELQALYPSHPPQPYASFRSHTREITKMQYQNEVLVVGTCDCALEFWIPNDRVYSDSSLDL